MNHGNEAEDILEQACHRIFGPDFVLRSPMLVEQTGRKELSDLFILVDDVAIIFQCKSLDMDVQNLDEISFRRICKRHEHAKKQINTALNAQGRGAKVEAVSSLNVRFTIDWKRIATRIGVISLNLRDAAYADPEFRFQFPRTVEVHRGIIVHTFLHKDLLQMFEELSTPGNVLLYLRVREKTYLSERLVIGNELDLLTLYKCRYPVLKDWLDDPGRNLAAMPGLWEDYQRSQRKAIADRRERSKNSRAIDRLIRELHESVKFSSEMQKISEQEATIRLLTIIGKLGKLTRVERTVISDKLSEKAEKTKIADFGYFIFVSNNANTAYLFLFSNEQDRITRSHLLQNLCVEACHHIQASHLLGIVTTGARITSGGTTAALFDVNAVKTSTTPLSFQFFEPGVPFTSDEWQPLEE